MDVGEDKVVKEIDVYLAQDDDPNLHLYMLQFPLRSPDRPYELEAQCEAVRVKPGQNRIELEIGLETESENYDAGAEEHLLVKTQTLCSTVVPSRASYAVGLLKDGALHLIPIDSTVQLRPSLAYLDRADEVMKQERDAALKRAGEKTAAELEEEEAPALTPLQLQIQRRETERQAEARLHSHAYLKQREEEEPWVELEAYGAGSETAAQLRDVLSVTGDTLPQMPFDQGGGDYLEVVAPVQVCQDGKRIGLSRAQLDTLPLSQRVQAIFSEGKSELLRYERIKRIVPEGSTEDELIAALEQSAVVVQGVWVAKSVLRCQHEENGSLKARLRDKLLVLFSRSAAVRKEEVDRLAGEFKKDLIKTTLQALSNHDPKKALYIFKEPTDYGFVSAHPEVVERQLAAWGSMAEHLDGSDRDAGDQGNSILESYNMPEVVEVALTGALEAMLKEKHVCSLKYVRKWLREDLRAGVAAQAASASDQQLLQLSAGVAYVIENTLVLPSLGDPSLDPFREVVLTLLMQNNKLVSKQQVMEAAKQQLGLEVPTSLFNRVTKELCILQKGMLKLRVGDD